jgi:hypothetical protein
MQLETGSGPWWMRQTEVGAMNPESWCWMKVMNWTSPPARCFLLNALLLLRKPRSVNNAAALLLLRKSRSVHSAAVLHFHPSLVLLKVTNQ